MAKPTVETLDSKEWWWKNPEWNSLMALLGKERTTPFNEKAAFRYELVRRFHRKKRFKGFLALPAKHIKFLEGIFGEYKAVHLPSRHNPHPDQAQEQGWTRSNAMLQWNLNVPDESLKMSFVKYIHQQRLNQGIPRPQRVPGKTKPIPWNWLELMDISDLKIRFLNDAERHRLSDARKNANIYARLFAKSVVSFDEKKPFPLETYEDYWGQDLLAILERRKPKLWKGVWPCEESSRT